MPATDIISHPGLNGPHEASVLGNGAQSRSDIGVQKYTSVDSADVVHLFGTRVVEVGDVFVRPVERIDGTTDVDPTGDGTYSWFGSPGLLEGALKINAGSLPENISTNVAAAGNMMVSPAGTPIFYGGERAIVPGVGEQALHLWTGEPLFDENGDPVLVE